MTTLFARPNRKRIKKNAADVGKAIESAESATLEARYKDVPLSKMEMEPGQPREVALAIDDVVRGQIANNDLNVEQKLGELEEIRNFAMTQKAVGDLYAPVGYERPGQRVRLIDGHRRYLSRVYKAIHIDKWDGSSVEILDAVKMTCKVYPKKPDPHEIEEIAIIGNIQRKELSLREMLAWAFRRNTQNLNDPGEPLGAAFFADTLGLKNSQAFKWGRIMVIGVEELEPIMDALKNGRQIGFNTVYKACSETNNRKRKALIDKLAGTGSARTTKKRKPAVILGRSSNLNALKVLIERNTEQQDLESLRDTDWSDAKAVQKAFKLFLLMWEQRYGE